MLPSIAGSTWRALLLLAVAAVDAGGARLKFAFTDVRNPGGTDRTIKDISLSELEVLDADGTVLTVAAISGHHNARHPNDGESPASLIDGDTATKWVDLNFTENGGESYLIVELQDGQPEPAAFQLFTNAQVAARGPAPLLSTHLPALSPRLVLPCFVTLSCCSLTRAPPLPLRRASRAGIRSTSVYIRRTTA